VDFRLEQWINHPAGNHAVFDPLMKHAAGWGEIIFILVVAVWFLVGWIRGLPLDRQGAITALLATGVALLANVIVAEIWTRPRPFITHPGDVTQLLPHAADASFPSDHAAAGFAIVAVLIAYRPKFGIVAALFALLMAYARVYVGIHYPGDVLAGALIGLIVGFAMVRWLSPLMLRLRELADWIIVTLRLPLPGPRPSEEPRLVIDRQ
jgi:undecaprenyl-diphosphatase